MQLRRFYKNWLLQSSVIWLLLNIADIFNFFANNYITENDNASSILWLRFINHNVHQGIWLEIIGFSLAVEINYQFVFNRYRYAALKFAACTIGLSLAFTALFILYAAHLSSYIVLSAFLPVPFWYMLYTGFYIFLRNYIEAGKMRAEQQQLKTAAELNTLKAQLNPHFFFNILNAVYGTALLENAPKTADITDRLSSLVRYVMEKTKNDVTTVEDEIKFIDDYFMLQQQRLPGKNNISVTKNVQCTAPALLIPPLIFIPFIENAFKYGLSIDRDCFIRFSLLISNSDIQMMIENSVVTGLAIQPGEGTGILNAGKRLRLLYPAKHTLYINESSNVFSVKLHITL